MLNPISAIFPISIILVIVIFLVRIVSKQKKGTNEPKKLASDKQEEEYILYMCEFLKTKQFQNKPNIEKSFEELYNYFWDHKYGIRTSYAKKTGIVLTPKSWPEICRKAAERYLKKQSN